MTTIAQFSPAQYVDNLKHLAIPGYSGFAGGIVAITSYSSANTMFTRTGSSSARSRDALSVAIHHITRGRPEHAFVVSDHGRRVFSGQGMPDDLIAMWAIVVTYEAEFRAVAALAPFFATPNYLQAMADAGCIGMDCIGFVGTYLGASGVTNGYVGRVPLGYSSSFPLVTGLDGIQDNSVVMLTNGMHIQIINRVTARHANYLDVELCQSSGPGGPQKNLGVRISAGGGSYLPVDQFREQMRQARGHGVYAPDFETNWNGQGDKNNAYESYLRRTMTEQNRTVGWHHGAIFQLGAGSASGANPANPVHGSVYVGTMRGGLAVRTPPARP